VPPHPPLPLARPSTWFEWQASRILPGSRVLDLACGTGRHAIAAALLGADVVAVDRDGEALATAREFAQAAGVKVDWKQADQEDAWPNWGRFDAVLVFNYLDRPRFPRALDAVRPGGLLIAESFLTTQREQGWGPTADAHLLLPGELARLIVPFEIMHGREVAEPVDTERWRHVASVCARNPG
jgi:2-polyprenyl-3-methyl-5-hydroxy-6-metoxy-1,4-benzoquinol methylase